MRHALVVLCSVFISAGAFADDAVLIRGTRDAPDVTIRAGRYAATNCDDRVLVTRGSSTLDLVRRALLDFDLGAVPAGRVITSAILTLTVHAAGTAPHRPVAVYELTRAFTARDATWDVASASTTWQTAGGDFGEEYARADALNTPGATVEFDVTALVDRVATQAGASRHTRILVADAGDTADGGAGYRDYYSGESATAAFRPTLRVTYAAAAPAVPRFGRVITIVMENKELGQIIGSRSAPFINRLAAQYGLATNYTGIRHPSLPNYMALTGGATFFTTNCARCKVSARNIADQVFGSGRRWTAYMESMPAACGRTDTRLYRQKHNPFVHYSDIVDNRTRCRNHVVPLTRFASDLRAGRLSQYVWVTPNMCSDMHDCRIATGDAWLSRFVPQILRSSAFSNGVLFLLWDEGRTNIGGGGRIPAVIVSRWTPAGFRSASPANHYSVLRTIEDAWRMGHLGRAAQARALSEFFRGR